jgi:hypothetical protein
MSIIPVLSIIEELERRVPGELRQFYFTAGRAVAAKHGSGGLVADSAADAWKYKRY